MAKITINGVSLDPMRLPMGLMALERPEPAIQSDYILVQTTRPLAEEDRVALEATGARLIEYVPDNTYLCQFAPTDLSPVTALPFVAWANVYPRGFKIAPALRQADAPPRGIMAMSAEEPENSMSQAPRPVQVVLHRDIDPEAVRAEIAEAVRADPNDLKISGQKVSVMAWPSALDRLSRLDAVRHIEEVVEPRLHNTVALGIIGADKAHSHVNLMGEGQVIAVCDTGLDTGSPATAHPAFAGRIRRIYPLGRPVGSDPHGHGTHVSGSVLGDGVSASMGGRVRGTAPRATLVLQSVLDANQGLGGLPGDLNTLFAQPYTNDGARVHTNSWGANTAGRYTTECFEVDEFVWNHRDMVILFSAGNSGSDRNANGVIDNGSVGSPGAAKNCITIGASESHRPAISKPYGEAWPSDFPASPVAEDLWADNPDGMAAFSSRGPTLDGRIKPDLVAPGTAILSCRSSLAPDHGFWGVSSDRGFCFMGGTSMATPLVAGCAALVREFLNGRDLAHPSAALVKAMLINGATDIPGQHTPPDAPAAPNFAEGFGRVDMPATVGPLPATTQVRWHDESRALATNEAWSENLTLEGRADLKVTLVWTDPPGETLQNDLDLIIRHVNGEERHGNVTPGSTAFDRNNNVEQIHWRDAPPGNYEITVRAYRAVVERQAFALVIRTQG